MSDYDAIDMTQRLLYQVTLASGRIVTRPDDFGDDDVTASSENYYWPVFSEDGRLLQPDRPTTEGDAGPTLAEASPDSA